jgi:cell division protein FtsA
VAMGNMIEQNDGEVSFTAMDGRTFRKVSRRFLMDIVEPRVEEIFTMVAEKLQDSGYADRVVPGGLILTGGGSLLKGIEQAAERILQLSARVG